MACVVASSVKLGDEFVSRALVSAEGFLYGTANSVLGIGSVPSIVLDSVDSKMNEVGSCLFVHSIPAPLMWSFKGFMM